MTARRRTIITAATAGLLLGGIVLPTAATAATGPTGDHKAKNHKPGHGKHKPKPGEGDTHPLIALTFDDGPSTLTPQVLKILAKHKIKATFFMQGSHVAQHPDIARQVVAAGNVVGNHSYTHPDFTQISDQQADEEITSTNTVITAATGVTPVLFRYPFGNESAAGNAVIRREQMWGGVLWHWDVNDPGDFECPGKKGVVQYVVDNAVDQGLILLHDGNDVLGCGRHQIKYLDRAITALERQGYRFGMVAPADGPSPVNQQSWVQVVAPPATGKK